MTDLQKQHMEKAIDLFMAGLSDEELLAFIESDNNPVETVLKNEVKVIDKFLGLMSRDNNLEKMSKEVYKKLNK